jgi:diadenylate cyclase
MPPASWDEQTDPQARQDPRLLKALDMVAPGTQLREGIDNVIHASTGALIVIGDPEEISFLFSGGIKLDVEYTPQLLYQVAKMDGAIVLDPDAERISWANLQLMPDPTIHSSETGTRHRTAERVSKQTSALVIAISARRDVVSLYLEGMKYILQDIPTVLSKANQGLATLEKYRARLDAVAGRLTSLELVDGASLHEVLTVLQRAELLLRTSYEVERYIIELGTEGRLIEMQLEETVVGVLPDRAALIRDYAADDSEPALDDTLAALTRLPHHDLLDLGRLAELLGHDRKVNPHDLPVSPRGYRALGRIPRLPRLVGEKVIQELGSLEAILAASETELTGIEGVGATRAADIREGLDRLREAESFDRYPQL